MKLLVIVPCGQAKIWKKEPNHGPAKAKNAYVGAPFKSAVSIVKNLAAIVFMSTSIASIGVMFTCAWTTKRQQLNSCMRCFTTTIGA